LIGTSKQERKHYGQKKVDLRIQSTKWWKLVGTSSKSWEDAAKNAGGRPLLEACVTCAFAEIVKQDMTVENGKVAAYRRASAGLL